MPIHHQHPPRKKWSLSMMVLAMGGIVLAALLVYVGLRIILGESPQDQSGQVVRQEATHNLDITYPVLKVGEVDASLKAFADSRADEFAAKIKGKSYDPRNKLTLEFQVPHYGERTLSVIFNQTEEIVGQKPVATQYLLNFDIDSGKRLTLADIFRTEVDARGELTKILHDYFRYDQPNTLNGDQLAKLKDMPLDKIRDFLFYDDMIVFYLNPKDPAKTDGAEPIAIKKSVLVSILQEVYAQPDKSRKPDIKPKPAYAINKLPALPPPPPTVAPHTGGGRIALTFDDGPSAHTNRLLDALAQHQARATFYILGHLASAYSGELQRMVRDGHEIGNHTWLHANLTSLNGPQLDHEIGDTQRIIQQVANYMPRTLRPPYGATNDTVAAYAAKWGLHVIMWSIDPHDWQVHNSQAVYDHIMSRATDGSVILLHDIYSSSVDAAIRAISDLKARGFQLVTVSEIYGL